MASYLDRRSPSGAEDAVGGVGVRSVLQQARTRRPRVISLDSGGGPCVPAEGERGRGREKEKEYARGWMRDRGRLMGERGVWG